MPTWAAASTVPLPARMRPVSSMTMERAAPTSWRASASRPMLRGLWRRALVGSGVRSASESIARGVTASSSVQLVLHLAPDPVVATVAAVGGEVDQRGRRGAGAAGAVGVGWRGQVGEEARGGPDGVARRRRDADQADPPAGQRQHLVGVVGVLA